MAIIYFWDKLIINISMFKIITGKSVIKGKFTLLSLLVYILLKIKFLIYFYYIFFVICMCVES